VANERQRPRRTTRPPACGDGHRDGVEADFGKPPGQVEAGEHALGEARRRPGDEQVDDAVDIRLVRRHEEQRGVARRMHVAGHTVELPTAADPGGSHLDG
jgi:hypothetical protein